jgi:hypothetical protein
MVKNQVNRANDVKYPSNRISKKPDGITVSADFWGIRREYYKKRIVKNFSGNVN